MNFRNIMMGGITITIVLLLISVFLVPVIRGLQVDPFTENFQEHTGTGEYEVDVVLSQSHYYDTSEEMSVTSDLGEDSAAILDYVNETDTVTVGGLTANNTRVLSVTYQIESSNSTLFTGFQTILWLIPAFLIVGIIWGIIRSFWS